MLIGICVFLIIGYLVLIIVDLAKYRLLSKAVVYYPIMLLAPAAATGGLALCIGTLVTGGFSFLIDGASADFGSVSLVSTLAVILAVAAAYTYIRGHISPIDRNSRRYEQCDTAVLKLYSAKRLIITGFLGTALYFAACIYLFFFVYRFHEISLSDISEYALAVIFMLIFAIIFPIAWVFVIALAIVAGSIIIQFALLLLASYLLNLLIANGCIRYIVRSDKSKPMKALFIFLSLIPVFNIVYGIICLKRISAELKQTNNC